VVPYSPQALLGRCSHTNAVLRHAIQTRNVTFRGRNISFLPPYRLENSVNAFGARR
jgi:hypothetical protein